MALTKDQKTAQVADLKDKMSKAQSIMFAHYIGLTVEGVSDFRKKLREGEAEMKVAKKTLMRLAAKDSGLPDIPDEVLEGPVACIFSFNEPLSGAQIAFKFGKDNEQVKLIGGFFEGKILSAPEAMELAQIPSHQALLGIFAGMCNSPLSSFARALSELAKQKEAGEEKKEEPAAEEKPVEEAKAADSNDTKDSKDESPESSESSESSQPSSTPEEKSAEEPKTEEAPAAEAAPTPEASTESSSEEEKKEDTPPAA